MLGKPPIEKHYHPFLNQKQTVSHKDKLSQHA